MVELEDLFTELEEIRIRLKVNVDCLFSFTCCDYKVKCNICGENKKISFYKEREDDD